MKKEENKIIYLDYASSTPIDNEVLSVVSKINRDFYANPSTIHKKGVLSKIKIDESRSKISKILDCQKGEIVFTSGATEANNLVVRGVINEYKDQKGNEFSKPHIITTNIEHPSVLEVLKSFKKEEIEITYLQVSKEGLIKLDDLKKNLKKNTILVSIIYANNEIGVIQSIKEITKILRHYKKNKSKNNQYPYFHTDASQAINYLMINVQKLGIDLMTFGGGKIYGPKGVGVLYKKRGVMIKPIIFGGDQEFGLRAGTENIASITGIARALEITESIKNTESKRLVLLRDYFIQKLLSKNKEIILNGHKTERLPNNINISIPKIESEQMVIELSAKGILVSEKSACKTENEEQSHVLKAIGQEIKNGALRISLGRDTTKKDLDYTLKIFDEVIKKNKKWSI